jgi:hypothetical protein
VKGAVALCILELHMIGDLLYNIKFPDVDLLEELFPQLESVYPVRRSLLTLFWKLYMSCRLLNPSRYSMR